MEAITKADVLIVEDSRTQALRLAHTLRRHKYEVLVAHDGEQALQMLQTHKARLVISDVEMPIMGGYELCRCIKGDAALRDLPVMLLTSLSAPRDVIYGLECGADHFMVKPYDEEWLISRIRFMLNGHAVTQTSERRHRSVFWRRGALFGNESECANHSWFAAGHLRNDVAKK